MKRMNPYRDRKLAKPLSDLLNSFMKKNLKRTSIPQSITNKWQALMGKYSEHSSPATYRNNILTIIAKSAPIYHELATFEISNIQERFSKILGKDITIRIKLH